MDATDASVRPQVRDDVVFRQLDDEWVIFDPVADRLHALNLSAALVWSHCTGKHALSEIAEAVGAAFTPSLSGAEILPDVEATLVRFRDEGLLQ